MATQRVETAVKTNEIMARFRPIAPKPTLAPPHGAEVSGVLSLQSRSRKRGRQDHVPAAALAEDKRQRGSSSYPPPTETSAQHMPVDFPRSDEHLLRLTIAGSRSSPWTPSPEVAAAAARRFPVERNLLRKLQEPKVIVPRPARPVRTTICVDTSSVTGDNSAKLAVCRMTAAQVVAELEHDVLPAVVSGSGNRVRLMNDAYKALVGQPVCPWLDSLPGAGLSSRINGEVVLDVRRFTSTEPVRAGEGGAFSCNSRISWERDGTLASVAVPCDVMRLDCNPGDYLFVWRFDTTRGSIFYCPV